MGYALNTLWGVQILNFMEQAPLSNAYNFSQASSNSAWEDGNTILLGNSAVNTTVVGAMVATYWCPSDDVPVIQNNTAVTYSNQNARTSNYYASYAQFTDYNCPGPTGAGMPQANLRGMFFNDVSTRIQEITDGTSNTMMIGETVQGITGKFQASYGPWWASGGHSSPVGIVYPASNSAYLSFLPNAPATYANPTYSTSANGGIVLRPTGGDFCSFHPGGIYILMADGSVRWIKNSVSFYPWISITTIAGNEILSSDSF